MFTTLVLGAMASMALLQQTDTVVSVGEGARLDLHGMGGDVRIRTWDRPEMRIVADHSSRDRIEVSRSGSTVKLRATRRRGVALSVDYNLTVPISMDLEIGGVNVSADIEGVRGSVKVETVQGDVIVRGGRRFITLESVQGRVIAEDIEGRIRLVSVNGEIRITNATGPVAAEAVNGPITMTGITSESVEATTVNGEIDYDGTIQDGGRYLLSSHNGDVLVTIPEGTNATVSVATFMGEFDSSFPVTLTDTRSGGKRFRFMLGDGSARIELDSFGGVIRLRRPAARR